MLEVGGEHSRRLVKILTERDRSATRFKLCPWLFYGVSRDVRRHHLRDRVEKTRISVSLFTVPNSTNQIGETHAHVCILGPFFAFVKPIKNRTWRVIVNVINVHKHPWPDCYNSVTEEIDSDESIFQIVSKQKWLRKHWLDGTVVQVPWAYDATYLHNSLFPIFDLWNL